MIPKGTPIGTPVIYIRDGSVDWPYGLQGTIARSVTDDRGRYVVHVDFPAKGGECRIFNEHLTVAYGPHPLESFLIGRKPTVVFRGRKVRLTHNYNDPAWPIGLEGWVYGRSRYGAGFVQVHFPGKPDMGTEMNALNVEPVEE